MSGEDYMNEVFNAYQTHDREMAEAKKLYDDARKEVKRYDQNGIGALVQMANEILPFYANQMKSRKENRWVILSLSKIALQRSSLKE